MYCFGIGEAIWRIRFYGLIVVVIMQLGMATPAWPVTFIVNSTADVPDVTPGDGICADASSNCTLRAAVQEANALAGTDAITLGAATYTLTGAAADDLALSGDLDITQDVTVTGTGTTNTFINGGSVDRVFDITWIIVYTEHGQNRVAEKFVDDTIVFSDHVRQLGEIGVEKHDHFIRWFLFGVAGEFSQITEQNGQVELLTLFQFLLIVYQ